MKNILFISILALFTSSAILGQTVSNLSYGTAAQQNMDIYYPKTKSQFTRLVVFVHGGAWMDGDKSEFKTEAEFLAANGIVAACINYQYADSELGINHNTLLSDIDKSINSLLVNTQKNGYNFTKLSLVGSSAGAHLALLYAYKTDVRNRVEQVIAFSSPTNFTDKSFIEMPFASEMFTNLTGSEDPLKWQEASPISYKKNVETHLYYCKQDMIVPFQQSVQLFNKIKTLNPKNSIKQFENCEHIFETTKIIQVLKEQILIH